MVGWHYRFKGHEFELAPQDSEGQGMLACCSPQGWKESDKTEQLNSNNLASNSPGLNNAGEFLHVLRVGTS